jgi:hypothetical protein
MQILINKLKFIVEESVNIQDERSLKFNSIYNIKIVLQFSGNREIFKTEGP